MAVHTSNKAHPQYPFQAHRLNKAYPAHVYEVKGIAHRYRDYRDLSCAVVATNPREARAMADTILNPDNQRNSCRDSYAWSCRRIKTTDKLEALAPHLKRQLQAHNKKHKQYLKDRYNESVTALWCKMGDVPRTQAESIVKVIQRGEIPHVTSNI